MKRSIDRRLERKHLLLILLGCMAWLLATGLFAWLKAPRWIPKLTSEAAALFGVQLEFEINHLSLTGATFHRISMLLPGISITADQMIVTANPKDWIAGRVDSLLIRGGEAIIHSEHLPAGESDAAPTVTTQSLERWIKEGIDYLPVRSLLLPDFEVAWVSETASLSVTLDASAIRSEGDWNLAIHGRFGTSSFHLLDHLVHEQGLRELEFMLFIPDPKSCLQEILTPAGLPTSPKGSLIPLLASGPLWVRLAWVSDEDKIDLAARWSEVALTDGNVGIGEVTVTAHSEDWLETVFVRLDVDPITIPETGTIRVRTQSVIHQLLSDARRLEVDFTTTDLLPSNAEDKQPLLRPLEGSLEFGPGAQATITLPSLMSPRAPLGIVHNVVRAHTEEGRWKASWTADIQATPEDFTIAGTDSPGLSLKAAGRIDREGKAPFPEIEFLLRPHILSYASRALSYSAEAYASFTVPPTDDTDTIPFAGKVSVNGKELRWGALRSPKASIDLNFRHPGIPWSSETSFPSLATMLTDLQSSLNLEVSGHWQEQPFSIKGLSAVKEPGDRPIALNADQLTWMQFEIDSVNGNVTAEENQTNLTLRGQSLNNTLLLGVDAMLPAGDPPQNATVHFWARTQDGDLLSEFPVHSITGTNAVSWIRGVVDLEGVWKQSGESSDLNLQGALKQGSWSSPDTGVSAQGIEIAACSIENLLTAPKGEVFEISAREVVFPPARIQDLKLQLQLLPDHSIQIHQCQFTMAQGRFILDFPEPIQAPFYETKVKVQFSEVELLEVIQMFPEVHDHIEGIVEGTIPITLEQGKLSWDTGFAKLMPGHSGKLIMSDQGFLAPHIPSIMIDPKTQTDIRTALKEISLSEIMIQLQSSAQFDTPSVLTLAGRSLDPNVSVPIERIQFNIRAPDLPDLINQGLNWNHGIPSFKLEP